MTRAKLVWLLLAVVLSNVVIGTVGITLTLGANARSDRQWCDLLGTLDDAYRLNPPVTDTGQDIARKTAALRARFGCPPSAMPQGDLRPTFSPRPSPTTTR
jgi:hypothetical protein